MDVGGGGYDLLLEFAKKATLPRYFVDIVVVQFLHFLSFPLLLYMRAAMVRQRWIYI